MQESNVWLLTLVAMGIGVLIGYLLARSSSVSQQALKEERDRAQAELNSYKAQVTEHFETTAGLVNGLTEQYRKVHQHLADGAQTLCADEHAGAVLQASLQPRLHKDDIPTMTDAVDNEEQEELPEPPRDYAPKRDDEEGTLSDRYGVKAEPREETAPDAEAPDSASSQDTKTETETGPRR